MKQIQRINQLWSIGKPKRWLNSLKGTTRMLHRAESCSTHSTGHYFHGRKLDVEAHIYNLSIQAKQESQQETQAILGSKGRSTAGSIQK